MTSPPHHIVELEEIRTQHAYRLKAGLSKVASDGVLVGTARRWTITASSAGSTTMNCPNLPLAM
jgi:hypothetical protein